MNKLVDLAVLLPGLAVLVATWIMFLRLRPKNGVIHPFVKNDWNCSIALFAFVAGNAFGAALAISGLVSFVNHI